MLKKKYIIKAFLAFGLLCCSFLIYHSAVNTGSNACASSQKEVLDTPKKQDGNRKMAWEAISHQFFSWQ